MIIIFDIIEQVLKALWMMWIASNAKQRKYLDEAEPPLLSRGTKDQAIPAPAPNIGEKVRLFAVLVGVNAYPAGGFPSLRGAIADALDWKDYLEQNLAVPSTQITVLTDGLATRGAIIDALKRLKDDNRIEKGDAILLYYAGHGTEMDPPAQWEAGGANAKIQAIVPYDCDLIIAGERVKALPDYTIGSLLSKIAEEKGDNITVVLDCCHSASGTRSASQLGGDDDVKARYVELKSPECPAQLDADLLQSDVGSRGPAVPFKHQYFGLASHILLAACGSGELAKERQGHGLFSSSLLKLLREVSPDSIRYSDILKHPYFPPIMGQNPQCEGINKGRALFNAKVLPPHRKSFPVRLEKDGYVVIAGTINRVTPGSKFTLYHKSDTHLTNPIGFLVARKVMPYLTITETPTQELDLTQPTIAILTGINNNKGLQIRIPSNTKVDNIYQALALVRQHEPNNTVCLVDNPEEHAHIEFERIRKDTVDIKVSSYYGYEFPATRIENDPDTLSRVLTRAANFYGELENTSKDNSILDKIEIEFKALADNISGNDLDEDQGNSLQPVGENLCNKNGIIELNTKDDNNNDVPYGMLITNNSPHDLYVALFHFCPKELSIVACASPHESGHHILDVPLKKQGGRFAVGYGAGGYQPLCFEAPDEGDIGFLKIYLTTEHVDLSYVEQTSLFENSRSLKPYVSKPKVSWTEKVFPIIQHKRLPTPVS